MKKLLFIFIMLCSLQGISQDNLLFYSEVVKINDTTTTKDQLYLKAKEWFVETFKSSQDVIQLEDKENGIIQGKAVIKYDNSVRNDTTVMVLWKQKVKRFFEYNEYVNFTIKISLKNGKYKYSFENFYVDGIVKCTSIVGTTSNITYKDENYSLTTNSNAYSYISDDLLLMIASLKNKMNEKINSDW